MRFRVAVSVLAGAVLLSSMFTGTARAETSPQGANDWTCAPSAAHPRPVVLVHGTFANMALNWPSLSPGLKRRGYCVFALNYGGTPGAVVQGTGDIARSAGQLSAFVDRVLAATGAAKVDIVGHSQGGMMPRYYLKFLGGAAKVRKLVGITPSNHGTSLSGLVALGDLLGITGPIVAACPACGQQIAGSDFLAALNSGGESVPGVAQTVIATRLDEVVTPYTSSFLSGTGVKNILLQSVCPLDLSAHLGVTVDPVVQRLVLDELDSPRGAINCLYPLG
ncbi:alpha/beta fold hydrolase [Sphaerisporangium album]|uniref:Alpha/beta fold hydrolase n=1 Tax=Sphaerisporangium album TaxID=509200 RepID=A0A367EUA9_9ACTN|nr:alpha/beta fold hydrolase [Sphaerisporangium album]RCG20987.1 alpha/beta fold hydrolase [Sphaerisporangium album]